MKSPNNIPSNNNRGNSDWLGNNVPGFNNNENKIMPETFQDKVNVYEKQCTSFMNPILEKFSRSDVNEIGNAFEYDYEVGYQVAVRVLSDLLDIKEPRIVFKTIEQNGDSHPYFHKEKGVICIPRKKGDGDDELLINAVDAISHEMWHAYQRDVIEKDGERADLYRENFSNYIPVERGVEDYLSQPVELEAYAFSGKIVDKFFDIRLETMWNDYNKTKRAIEEFKENGNEHLVDGFMEDNQKRLLRLKELTGGEYFKRRTKKKSAKP